MTAAVPPEPRKPTTFKLPESIWEPFKQLTSITEQATASVVVRRYMKRYLDDYHVFWAEAAPDDSTMVAWFDCEECDKPHRLDGAGTPWGCTVTKARQDREAKEQARG